MIARVAPPVFGLAVSFASVSEAWAANKDEPKYSEYSATVIRIIDGDSIAVEVDLWPGLVAKYTVRVRGIDAPELRRVGCEEERAWGLAAQKQAARLYDVGSKVKLKNVEYDSFSGRVVADIFRWRSDRWLSFSDEMIDRGMALAWTPKMDDVPWCLLAQSREQSE